MRLCWPSVRPICSSVVRVCGVCLMQCEKKILLHFVDGICGQAFANTIDENSCHRAKVEKIETPTPEATTSLR